MRIIIIEDEPIAAKKLEDMLVKYDPKVVVDRKLGSVEECMDWLQKHKHPDLILADIELRDGSVFEVFQQVQIDVPIVFVTHYESFLRQSLEVNGISFITKPISQDAISKALKKYESLKKGLMINWEELIANAPTPRIYRKRFISKVNGQLHFAEREEIAYFTTQYRATYLVTFDGKRMIMDKPLNRIYEELDPKTFYRANRKFIISSGAIQAMQCLEDGSEQVTLTDESVIVITRTKVRAFRHWFDR